MRPIIQVINCMFLLLFFHCRVQHFVGIILGIFLGCFFIFCCGCFWYIRRISPLTLERMFNVKKRNEWWIRRILNLTLERKGSDEELGEIKPGTSTGERDLTKMSDAEDEDNIVFGLDEELNKRKKKGGTKKTKTTVEVHQPPLPDPELTDDEDKGGKGKKKGKGKGKGKSSKKGGASNKETGDGAGGSSAGAAAAVDPAVDPGMTRRGTDYKVDLRLPTQEEIDLLGMDPNITFLADYDHTLKLRRARKEKDNRLPTEEEVELLGMDPKIFFIPDSDHVSKLREAREEKRKKDLERLEEELERLNC